MMQFATSVVFSRTDHEYVHPYQRRTLRSRPAAARAEFGSIPQQIEFWAKPGRAAYDNPDLPIDFIRDILLSRMEDPADAEPFVPEGSVNG